MMVMSMVTMIVATMIVMGMIIMNFGRIAVVLNAFFHLVFMVRMPNMFGMIHFTVIYLFVLMVVMVFIIFSHSVRLLQTSGSYPI